jgi:YfiH family protein
MRNEKNHGTTKIAAIRIGISTKSDGSMKLADGTNDFENIKKFLLSKKLSPKFVRMRQIHSGNIAIVTNTSDVLIKDTDGLITQTSNISLTIVTADCLPILFSDDKKHVIGAVHAGSKGLAQNIIHNTLEIFKKQFNSDPADVSVTIGPSIEQKCYEVGQEVIQTFSSNFSWFDSTFYTNSKEGHYFLNLRNIALHSLLKEGILEENMTISDECTKCNADKYYSYRGGDKIGRFLSSICIL